MPNVGLTFILWKTKSFESSLPQCVNNCNTINECSILKVNITKETQGYGNYPQIIK